MVWAMNDESYPVAKYVSIQNSFFNMYAPAVHLVWRAKSLVMHIRYEIKRRNRSMHETSKYQNWSGIFEDKIPTSSFCTH